MKLNKLFSIFAVAILISVVMPSNATESKEKITIYDSYGNKIMEKVVSESQADKIEKSLLSGDATFLHKYLPRKFDFGIMSYIFSYGEGKVFIPFHKDRSFIRLFLRPIFFQYEKGVTITKLGANYAWDRCKKIGDYGIMMHRQRGILIGFVGVHVKITHYLRPDSHFLIGASFITIGNDLLM